jgi:hypothetical protein
MDRYSKYVELHAIECGEIECGLSQQEIHAILRDDIEGAELPCAGTALGAMCKNLITVKRLRGSGRRKRCCNRKYINAIAQACFSTRKNKLCVVYDELFRDEYRYDPSDEFRRISRICRWINLSPLPHHYGFTHTHYEFVNDALAQSLSQLTRVYAFVINA